jgi:imidazolonepropionase-like amidohydrolase
MKRTETKLSRADLLKGGLALAAGAAAPAVAPTPANAAHNHRVPAQPPTPPPPSLVLFTNVRVFDGKSAALSGPKNVLVRGNKIETVSTTPIRVEASLKVRAIDGGGRTLMPGLIDAHTHIMFAILPQAVMLTSDPGFIHVAATKAATDTLLRGFTTIRDVGGPAFGLKRGIDMGMVVGPRIYPSGAMISQSGGHADFRLPNELPAPPDYFSNSERYGASAIADDPATVRKRARELLALGASHIKVHAGGGASSNYDPLDVTQYTVEELRAAVEAAENWGTYVTVHAYTPRSIGQAIEAGVKCLEHGQLIDEATVKRMADKGMWWCLQPFTEDRPTAFAEGSPNRLKQLQVAEGTDKAYNLAKKYKIKTAWGCDALFDPALAARENTMLALLTRWYTSAEVLKMGTADNAELLALSGPRNPYPGKLGVVEEGALADLLLVDGDPVANIKIIEDPAKNFVIIMKDGKIYKDTLAK